MIMVNKSFYDDEGSIIIASDNEIQLEKEVGIITKFLLSCKGVEVDDYFLDSDYPISIFTVYLKPDYQKNWIKFRKSLDNTLMLYCKSKLYNIT